MKNNSASRIPAWAYVVPIGALAIFSVLLISKFVPAIGATEFMFLYVLLLMLLLPLCALVFVTCAFLILWDWLRGKPRFSFVRAPLVASSLSLVAFILVLVVARSVSGALPTGSYESQFNSTIWQATESAQWVETGITARQGMLGDVVENVLPGTNREEIERLLGTTRDTPYFRSTGRDMIYLLGPERDSLFVLDSEWLLIWLNDGGEFERFEVRVD